MHTIISLSYHCHIIAISFSYHDHIIMISVSYHYHIIIISLSHRITLQSLSGPDFLTRMKLGQAERSLLWHEKVVENMFKARNPASLLQFSASSKRRTTSFSCCTLELCSSLLRCKKSSALAFAWRTMTSHPPKSTELVWGLHRRVLSLPH